MKHSIRLCIFLPIMTITTTSNGMLPDILHAKSLSLEVMSLEETGTYYHTIPGRKTPVLLREAIVSSPSYLYDVFQACKPDRHSSAKILTKKELFGNKSLIMMRLAEAPDAYWSVCKINIPDPLIYGKNRWDLVPLITVANGALCKDKQQAGTHRDIMGLQIIDIALEKGGIEGIDAKVFFTGRLLDKLSRDQRKRLSKYIREYCKKESPQKEKIPHYPNEKPVHTVMIHKGHGAETGYFMFQSTENPIYHWSFHSIKPDGDIATHFKMKSEKKDFLENKELDPLTAFVEYQKERLRNLRTTLKNDDLDKNQIGADFVEKLTKYQLKKYEKYAIKHDINDPKINNWKRTQNFVRKYVIPTRFIKKHVWAEYYYKKDSLNGNEEKDIRVFLKSPINEESATILLQSNGTIDLEEEDIKRTISTTSKNPFAKHFSYCVRQMESVRKIDRIVNAFTKSEEKFLDDILTKYIVDIETKEDPEFTQFMQKIDKDVLETYCDRSFIIRSLMQK